MKAAEAPKRWSVLNAFLVGLGASVSVALINWSGAAASNPAQTMAGAVAYWIGLLSPAPVIFTTIAVVRNWLVVQGKKR